jgi:hypothetical protein
MYRREALSRLKQWALLIEQRTGAVEQIIPYNGSTLARGLHGSSLQPLRFNAAAFKSFGPSSGILPRPAVGVVARATAAAHAAPWLW